MSDETCANCGVDVDKEPMVLCDDCEDPERIRDLEAQAAAMREALLGVVESQDRFWAGHPEKDRAEEPGIFAQCRAALAPDAGKALPEALGRDAVRRDVRSQTKV